MLFLKVKGSVTGPLPDKWTTLEITCWKHMKNGWWGWSICFEDNVSHPASSCFTLVLLSCGSSNEQLYCACKIYIMHTFILPWARAFNNMFWSVLQLLQWHNRIFQDHVKLCLPHRLSPCEGVNSISAKRWHLEQSPSGRNGPEA